MSRETAVAGGPVLAALALLGAWCWAADVVPDVAAWLVLISLAGLAVWWRWCAGEWVATRLLTWRAGPRVRAEDRAPVCDVLRAWPEIVDGGEPPRWCDMGAVEAWQRVGLLRWARSTPSGVGMVMPVPGGASGARVCAREDHLSDAIGVTARVIPGEPGTVKVEIGLRNTLRCVGIHDFAAEHHYVTNPIEGLPVALLATGDTWAWPGLSTLIVGATGSGKSSVLWAFWAAMEKSRNAGLARLWWADPKRTEIHGRVALVDRGATEPGQIAAMLSDAAQEIDRRSRITQDRQFRPSRDMPLLVVIVDELPTLPTILGKEWRAAEENLKLVLRLGRAVGVAAVLASQEATKEAISVRDLCPVRAALRTATATETALVLGADAVTRGARPHEIEPATPENGYKTAGLGWVIADGVVTPVRFPYVSDEYLNSALDDVRSEMEAVRAEGTSDAVPQDVEPGGPEVWTLEAGDPWEWAP